MPGRPGVRPFVAGQLLTDYLGMGPSHGSENAVMSGFLEAALPEPIGYISLEEDADYPGYFRAEKLFNDACISGALGRIWVKPWKGRFIAVMRHIRNTWYVAAVVDAYIYHNQVPQAMHWQRPFEFWSGTSLVNAVCNYEDRYRRTL